MRLAQRLGRNATDAPRAKTAGPADGGDVFVADSRQDMASLAQRLHQKIIDHMDLAQVSRMSPEQLRPRLRQIVEQLVVAERLSMAATEQAALADQVLDELIGHGPLEPLLNDDTVSDVLVNGFDKVYVERNGKVVETDIRFRDDAHLGHTIQRMVARVGPGAVHIQGSRAP